MYQHDSNKALGAIGTAVPCAEPGIPYAEAPALYRTYDIFVNQSPSGMFDKTIFEAMACET